TGDEIQLDLRDGAQQGDAVTFDNVLLVSGDGGVKVGQPKGAGASVAAEVLGQEMGEKLYIQKMRRRKNFRRRTGHRQMYTRVRIGAITGSFSISPRIHARCYVSFEMHLRGLALRAKSALAWSRHVDLTGVVMLQLC